MSYDEKLERATNYCRNNSGYSVVKLGDGKKFLLVRCITGSRSTLSRSC